MRRARRRAGGSWGRIVALPLLAIAVASCGLILALEPPQGSPLPPLGDARNNTTRDGPAGNAKPVTVWSGVSHMCATYDDGQLYCWGTNTSGQLGVGDTNDHPTPAKVEFTQPNLKIAQVSIGAEHTCAIDRSQSAGAVWCWGRGSTGVLGLEDTSGRLTPARTSINDALSIQTGESHTCVFNTRSQIFCWGTNEWGTIGTGLPFGATEIASRPEWVNSISPTALADGYGRHACAIATVNGEGGHVFCWGYNGLAALGDGTTEDRNVPVEVPGIVGAVRVHLGLGNTCAEFADRSLSCWGTNQFGQLADGTRNGRAVPGSGPAGLPPPSSMQIGFGHMCSTDFSGTLRCWGGGWRGAIGLDAGHAPDGAPFDLLAPTRVALPGPVDDGGLSGRAATVCARVAGSFYCWGANGARQLITGDDVDRFQPTPLPL